MAVLNFAHREITAKIVYFGAIGAGCTTNVRALHEQLADDERFKRSGLHRFGPAGADEHTWYFDLSAHDADVEGFRVRYRVYSMPGGLDDPELRAQVMRQVDAVVLVADSRPEAQAGNEAALLELEDLVSGEGLDLARLPVVLQVNHTDADGARRADDVVADLNPFGFPVIPASARSGDGVDSTFRQICALTRERLAHHLRGRDQALTLVAEHQRQRVTDADVAQTHRATPATSLPPQPLGAANVSRSTPPPPSQVEVPFQSRDLAGSYPIRVIDASIDDGQAYVDLELERMGGGERKSVRVKLANRPTDVPAVANAPVVSLVTEVTPSVMGVTDHLPDRIDATMPPLTPVAGYSDLAVAAFVLAATAAGTVLGLLLGELIRG